MTTTLPELSIIVPALNDADELQGLFTCLANQSGILFEVIICDGGSHDTLQDLVREWQVRALFPLRLIKTDRGRGLQMNAGSVIASGDTLLFLHADSRFDHNEALFSGVADYKQYRSKNSSMVCAARFRLTFRRAVATPSLSYYFHESKARLNRSECIRGDQGYLIDRKTFEQLGRFDCTLPFLEDVSLSARISMLGDWLLLPPHISTSARRFEQEGFFERQILNVIIVNAVETGWDELLFALPELYRSNCSSGRLILFPLLESIRTMILGHDKAWQKSFWRATGRHVASNAWQLFFLLDVRRGFRTGQNPESLEATWLIRYEQFFKPLFESRLAGGLANSLTRLWFWWMLKSTRTSFTIDGVTS